MLLGVVLKAGVSYGLTLCLFCSMRAVMRLVRTLCRWTHLVLVLLWCTMHSVAIVPTIVILVWILLGIMRLVLHCASCLLGKVVWAVLLVVV